MDRKIYTTDNELVIESSSTMEQVIQNQQQIQSSLNVLLMKVNSIEEKLMKIEG